MACVTLAIFPMWTERLRLLKALPVGVNVRPHALLPSRANCRR
jgi:hypothetical protein